MQLLETMLRYKPINRYHRKRMLLNVPYFQNI